MIAELAGGYRLFCDGLPVPAVPCVPATLRVEYVFAKPLRGEGVFTISVGRAGGILGVPHCPQNASSGPTSFPHFGHFIDTSSSWSIYCLLLFYARDALSYSYPCSADCMFYGVYVRVYYNLSRNRCPAFCLIVSSGIWRAILRGQNPITFSQKNV